MSESSELRNAFQEYVVARDIDLNRPHDEVEDGGYRPTERHRVAIERIGRAFADADRLAAEHAALVAAVWEAYDLTIEDIDGGPFANLIEIQRILRDALAKDG